jgi:tetratricopeptide (TPR) repeat protein
MRLAMLLLAAGMALRGQEASAAHREGLKQYGAHDYRAAAEAFRKAMETEAAGSAARSESALLLGESLYLTGHYPEAAGVLRDAARTGESLYMLGNSYLKMRDFASAVKTFAAMFGVGTDSAAAHLLTAQMMIRQELEDEAEKELERVIVLDPNLPQAHFLMGELKLFKGNIDQACEQLKLEIAINPASAMAYYKLGDAYGRQEQWEVAIPLLQKSIWLNSTNSGPYVLLGKGYLRQKQLSNAEGMLRRAVQLDPRNSSAHFLLGQTLIQEGRAEEGKAMLTLSQKLKQ